jgi:GTP diphosphokinase / guanosine-3',5'-bis(diphosphate) 3'-diphosphatase
MADTRGTSTVVSVKSLVESVREVGAALPDAVDGPALAAAEELERSWARHHDRPVDPLVIAATRVAVKAHAGQRRRSGELYISHPLLVAAVCASAGFDQETVAAAICHDVVEDCDLSVADLAAAVSPGVARLVDGVSKVERVHFPSAEQAEAASMTKFLVAVVDDVRVLAIKLADRLHNLRTASVLAEDRQRRLAREALEVFSPLAHRLGMEELRREMEDLAFSLYAPDAYAALAALVAARAPEAARVGADVADRVAASLAELDLPAEVSHRIKHLYSLHRKHTRNGGELSAIHDLIGVRAIVESVSECYTVLGAVHTMFTPVPGRFKDFVALPKANGYQSLHTTVVVDGLDVEVQIRSRSMHAQACFGVAAHYGYKEGSTSRPQDSELADAWESAATPEEFLERIRAELAPAAEVVLLTPKGRPVVLPAGSCAVDFAYKIHTEVGHRCIGAKVDGRLVPIRTPLRTGQVIEILTANNASPRADWVQVCKTARARERIRKFLADQSPGAPTPGRTLLAGELRQRGVDPAVLDDDEFTGQLAALNDRASLDGLFDDLASGKLRPRSLRGLPARVVVPSSLPPPGADDGFDLSGLPFTIARCCNPTSRDEAAGYITQAHAVSVHRVDCGNYLTLVRNLPADSVGRLVGVARDGARRAWVEVRSGDRAGLLRDLSATCSDLGVNILAATSTSHGAEVISRFEFAIADADHLNALAGALRAVPAVASVATSG